MSSKGRNLLAVPRVDCARRVEHRTAETDLSHRVRRTFPITSCIAVELGVVGVVKAVGLSSYRFVQSRVAEVF